MLARVATFEGENQAPSTKSRSSRFAPIRRAASALLG